MQPLNLDYWTQNLVNQLYQLLRPNLEPRDVATLDQVCAAAGPQGAAAVQSELYRLLNPYLDPSRRELLGRICNAHAAYQGQAPAGTSMANAGLQPPSTQLPAPPAGCVNPVWIPETQSWACQMPKPNGGGGGCGCGGHKPPALPPGNQQPPAPYPPQPPAPQQPIPVFSNGCKFPCPPPAVTASSPASPATNPYVNMNGGINCLWYDQSQTLCEIKKIKETEKQTSQSIEAVLTDPGTYEFDLPAVGVASGLCLLSFRLFSLDKSAEYTDIVGGIELRQVKQVQSPTGESLLVYGDIVAAAGSRLTTTNGRCECTQLCVCQPATLPVRVVIKVDPPGDPASILIEFDAERAWADDACIQCFPCGIPQQCGEDEYTPLN